MFTCPKCYAKHPDGTDVCKYCGLELHGVELDNKLQEADMHQMRTVHRRNLWFRHGVMSAVIWFCYYSIFANGLNLLTLPITLNIFIGLMFGFVFGFPIGYFLSWSGRGMLCSVLLTCPASLLSLVLTLQISPMNLSPLRILISGLGAGPLLGIILHFYIEFDGE